MAGELNIALTSTGLVVKGMVYAEDHNNVWDSSAFSAVTGLTDSAWSSGLVTMTELQTADSTRTAMYVADFPTGITISGDFSVIYYTGSPVPSDRIWGTQEINWNGSYSSPSIYVADLVLSRDLSNVEDIAAKHSLCTMALAALEGSVSGTGLTINKTDGTLYLTIPVTTDSLAAPVVGVNA
jgi:hypothetical protein